MTGSYPWPLGFIRACTRSLNNSTFSLAWLHPSLTSKRSARQWSICGIASTPWEGEGAVGVDAREKERDEREFRERSRRNEAEQSRQETKAQTATETASPGQRQRDNNTPHRPHRPCPGPSRLMIRLSQRTAPPRPPPSPHPASVRTSLDCVRML